MFLGRKKELSELERRYRSNKKEFGIIWGRRRIGKTSLINEFCQNKNALMFQAKQDNAFGNLRSFSYELNKLLKLPKNYVFSSWEEAFDSIIDFAEEKRFLLVIDEYPYIVSQDSSFSSVLQNFIDKAGVNIFLILSGSNISFLKEQINDEKSPLYKRKTFAMEIKKLGFEEACLFLSDFSNEDKCNYLALMLGYPYYLSAINHDISFEDNVLNLICNEYGIFFDLPNQVLSNSTKCQDVYNAILRSIAYRHRSIQAISDDIHEETGKVSKYLETLINSEIVEKRTTFMGNKKTNYYEISDPMMKFWYKAAFENQARIKMNKEMVFESIKPILNDFVCHGFEDVCKEFLDYLNRKGKLKYLFPTVQNYKAEKSILGRSVEIDGMARVDDELLVVECKYRNQLFNNSMFEHLVESASIFPDKLNRHYYIFSKSGFEKKLKRRPNLLTFTLDDIFKI